MKFYIGLQQNDWCPDQTYFAETAPGTAFFSEKGAMFQIGRASCRERVSSPV